jgi:hypothetical protein
MEGSFRRRQGDTVASIAGYGTYDIHRTNVTGSHSFADSPVDLKGHWIIDGQGNICSVPGAPEALRGGERRV